ncbi:TonB C-terminal domain-containing protein [Comamonas sp. JC664]|uniref:TonB C-terminal domain-containing protein n=1 Tax=Comamonas sp. JC664 TaxID=2801917 RepID=UPI00191EF67F|nr:TonB C-terminal domain-containing protein [Comamonas sp. JC664]
MHRPSERAESPPAPATEPVAPPESAPAPFEGDREPRTPPDPIAVAPDAPRRAPLSDGASDSLPSFLIPGGAPTPGPKTPGGRTLRPGDPGPSAEELAAQERTRVTGRVETFIVDDQAELRVANGLIDSYFSRLREALEKGLEDAPVFPGTSLLKQASSAWAPQAQKFGATGSTGAGAPPRAPTVSEQLYGLQQRAGDESVERPRLFAQAGRELQHLATGGGSKLVVTLELVQNVDGTLRDVKLVARSGNPTYDAYVLNAIPGSLAKLAAPPEGARGVRDDGIHTLWSVEGRVVYLRKLKELESQDAWYVAAASAAGILAGRFEETTGDIEVIDFRNPRFVCQSRLLRVY